MSSLSDLAPICVNGVEETPTVFLNGRRWVGDLAIEEFVSPVEEEAARVRVDVWLSG